LRERAPDLTSHAGLVAAGALAIGLADAALIVNGQLGAAGAFQYVPPRVWGVSPLCWGVVALIAALPSLLVSRHRWGAWTTIALLTLFGSVRLYGQTPPLMLAGGAVLLAAIGVVWFAASWWIRRVRPIASALLAAAWVAVIVMAVTAGDAPRSSPRSPASSSPDVIVIFLDTVPYDSIFRRGTDVAAELPFFSSMASGGVVFHRAYSTSPWTLPAHFSAVTGLPAHKLGTSFDDQHYDGTTATLAERFRRRGYRTVAVISNTFLNRGTGFARGFDVFEQSVNALDVCRTAPGTLLDRWWPWFAAGVCNWTASAVTRRAIEHVPSAQQPLFLLLNFMDAHDPYYVERDCARPASVNPLPRNVPPAEYRRRYYPSHLAAVRCIDRQLANLEAGLARRGRDAVFVVLADHGEQFGEHGLVRHGNSLYSRLLHVPFMVRAPHLAPRHVAEPVSTESLPRLVLDVVEGRQAGTPKNSIASSLLPPAALRQEEQWSILAGRWHLIRKNGREVLYDVLVDPAEERDLAGHPAALPALRKLSTELDREKSTRVDPREGTFRALGYVR
jgi:arylsulfatase A-like enzyme